MGNKPKNMGEHIIQLQERIKELENPPNPYFLVAPKKDLSDICHNKDRLCDKCWGECKESKAHMTTPE